jgi:hypothetical protein
MNKLFVISNLLSIKAANAIDEMESSASVYLSIRNDDDVFSTLQSYSDSKIERFPMLGTEGNIVNLLLNIVKYKRDVRNFLMSNSVNNVFLTNPLHIESSIFYKEARKLNIKISFYEEGICFYRILESNQYDATGIVSKTKKRILRILGLYKGYGLTPDKWYSSLDFPYPSQKISLKYKRLEVFSNIKTLFLSRPASEDFPGVTIDDELQAISVYYDRVGEGNEALYIKFHPREGVDKRTYIINKLKDKYDISAIELTTNVSSEDILYSMKSGSIGGYETTTLVYGYNINPSIKYYSVGYCIAKKDTSQTIYSFLNFYKENFSHIEYLLNNTPTK